MIKKQNDPRMKSHKQTITRFEEFRQMIKDNIEESLENLQEAQKHCLDEGSKQMELFAEEKLQYEIDHLENLFRHVDSLIPENIKRGG